MTQTYKLEHSFNQLIDSQPVEAKFLIAYSGGLDSTVLLHLTRNYCRSHDRELKALYINHHLQGESDDWEIHCRSQCELLDVEYQSLSISTSLNQGESTEAWARNERYKLFAGFMDSNTILMTAHHQDDQAETLLLQLFRGAGPPGLSAMPSIKAFAKGKLLRPLLSITRAELEEFAKANDLKWIEDPSNYDVAYDRNFIRQEILPQLKTHWPSLTRTLARSASNIASMNLALDDYIQGQLKSVQFDNSVIINLRELLKLSKAIQALVIRHWLKMNDLDIPSSDHLNRIQQDVVNSGIDSQAEVIFGSTIIRKYRKGLFATRLGEIKNENVVWNLMDTFQTSIGVLCIEKKQGKGIRKDVIPESGIQIQYREGGERIKLKGHQHHSEIKKLMQETGILPWYRNQIPFIYIQDQLVQVPGFWLSAEFAADKNEEGVLIHWRDDMSFLTPDV